VNPLTTFVQSLGNAGALANVQVMLDARGREDWLVEGLARRLEGSALPTTATTRRAVVA